MKQESETWLVTNYTRLVQYRDGLSAKCRDHHQRLAIARTVLLHIPEATPEIGSIFQELWQKLCFRFCLMHFLPKRVGALQILKLNKQWRSTKQVAHAQKSAHALQRRVVVRSIKALAKRIFRMENRMLRDEI